MTVCQGCDRSFSPVLPSHRLCRVCWSEARGDINMAFAELAWQKGHELGFARGRTEVLEGTLGALPLRELIVLCHPDRHPPERAGIATEITAWLNGLRDAARAAG